MRRVLHLKFNVFVVGGALALSGCADLDRMNADLTSSLQRISLPSDFVKAFGKQAPKKMASISKSQPKPKPKPKPAIATEAKAMDLAPEDIKTVLTGNSVYAGGGGLEFAAMHKPDGALAGKAWSDDGTTTGIGIWRLEADGTYCRKWDNAWADGEWGCFKIERKGNRLSMHRISGAGSDGEMTLVPGNAYGL